MKLIINFVRASKPDSFNALDLKIQNEITNIPMNYNLKT